MRTINGEAAPNSVPVENENDNAHWEGGEPEPQLTIRRSTVTTPDFTWPSDELSHAELTHEN